MDKSKDEQSNPKPEASKVTKPTIDASSVKQNEEKIIDVVVKAVQEEEPIAMTESLIVPDQAKLEAQQAVKNTPINNLNTPDELYEFSKLLVAGKMCPFKDPSDAMIAIIAGKELGLSLAATLGGIYPIEGKPSLGVHVKKGILLQNNVLFKKVRDMEPYYEFVKIVDTKPSVVAHGYLNEQPKDTKKKQIDIRTEYLFTRHFVTVKGIVTNTAIGMFGLVDATSANLLAKNNWKNYFRDMLASRAFSRGANEIADDLLHGMYSYSELADLDTGITYYIDENGHEQIVT
tara:strand:- start:41193 stop:42059 length:867 start_codon:yes stop_codon:yes gene_type:complete